MEEGVRLERNAARHREGGRRGGAHHGQRRTATTTVTNKAVAAGSFREVRQFRHACDGGPKGLRFMMLNASGRCGRSPAVRLGGKPACQTGLRLQCR